jgi:hypothetical protein
MGAQLLGDDAGDELRGDVLIGADDCFHGGWYVLGEKFPDNYWHREKDFADTPEKLNFHDSTLRILPGVYKAITGKLVQSWPWRG